jgi:hypothetical protein
MPEQMGSARSVSEERRAPQPAPRPSSRGPSGLLLTGLVVVGLGALAWYVIGPDIKRYMKIRSM